MQLSINEKREITSYVIVGSIVGGVEVSDNDNYFMKDFEPTKYILTDELKVIENETYKKGGRL